MLSVDLCVTVFVLIGHDEAAQVSSIDDGVGSREPLMRCKSMMDLLT